MRTLYLVYRVTARGERHPETIMGLDESELAQAPAILDQLVSEDNPDYILREGEQWDFVPQERAPQADWEEIAPPDGKSMPY
jgi:hypothetical protein